MTVIGEEIPLCHCSTEFERVGIDLDRARLARGTAVDLFYNEYIDPSKVDKVLLERGFTIDEARCATNACLFRFMRGTCGTAEVNCDPENPELKTLVTKTK